MMVPSSSACVGPDALIVVFDSKEAHDAYQEAPLHLKFIAENRETWAKVRVFDATLEGA